MIPEVDHAACEITILKVCIFLYKKLVVEVPGQSEADYHRVDRIMRCPEGVSVHGRVNVTSHYVEAEVLQKQVGIDVADRVVTDSDV